MPFPPKKKKIFIISLALILTASVALVGYFYFTREKEEGVSVETAGIRATMKKGEIEYHTLVGEIVDRRGVDEVLIKNSGEQKWVKIDPDRILSSALKGEDEGGGKRTLGQLRFFELETGRKITIFDLEEGEADVLRGGRVLVWSD